MPFTETTRNAAFASAPFAANTAVGNRVTLHAAARFDPMAPFVLCVFFHGWEISKGSREAQIAMAVAQMEATETNSLLVAPKFGVQSEEGGFGNVTAFSTFVLEIEKVLPGILVQSGMDAAQAAQVGRAAARTAKILLVAFSGGWKPLGAALKGLLALDTQAGIGAETRCADRLAGIQLLDCIYGDTSSSGVIAWDQHRRNQAALTAIYGRNTASNAMAANHALLKRLRPDQKVLPTDQWAALPKPMSGGSVAFFEVDTAHMSIPSNGPPLQPVAAFLDLLAP